MNIYITPTIKLYDRSFFISSFNQTGNQTDGIDIELTGDSCDKDDAPNDLGLKSVETRPGSEFAAAVAYDTVESNYKLTVNLSSSDTAIDHPFSTPTPPGSGYPATLTITAGSAPRISGTYTTNNYPIVQRSSHAIASFNSNQVKLDNLQADPIDPPDTGFRVDVPDQSLTDYVIYIRNATITDLTLYHKPTDTTVEISEDCSAEF